MKRVLAIAAVLVLISPAPAPATRNAWQHTPVPVSKGDINAIATLDERTAWAVGYELKSLTRLESFALRWDGTTWRRESTLPAQALPKAVAVASERDIWTVGRTEDLKREGLETAHWNGTAWTSHSLARGPAGYVMPEAITASGGVWMAGRALTDWIKSGMPAIQRWDGAQWVRQSLPDVGPGELVSITATAPDDVWAAGVAYTNPQTPLLLHWNGSTWQKADVSGAQTWLSGVTALSRNDVWVVGGTYHENGDRPFAAHWNGRKWTVTRTPRIADGRLEAVGRTADGRLWAVGGKGGTSVALRWSEPLRTWYRTPAPDAVVRGFAATGNTLWSVGIAGRGDLVPTVLRARSDPRRPW